MRLFALLLVVSLFTACSPAAVPTPAPTLTLIAATPVDTPTPIPPTQTPLPLPAPGDLDITPTNPEGTEEAVSADDLVSTDPIAAELVALAQRIVADQLDLPSRRVRLVDVQPVTWEDTGLGCPSPDQSYSPAEVPGYRIVLTTGDEFHLFHTDFDRVIQCDAALESLPNGVSEATAEATAES